MAGGNLYSCQNCGLRFRYPRISEDRLTTLYKQGAPEAWPGDVRSRTDWLLAKTAIEERFACGSVLDLGCFSGGFLTSLSDGFLQYGIELHGEAAGVAASKGVRMLADDFAALETLTERFDVVTAFDVIEHVDDPAKFLEGASKVLKPGGLLIVSTGDAEFFGWRWARGRYWYCVFPEHISFISSSWLANYAHQEGLAVIDLRRFARHVAGPMRRVRELVVNLLYIYAAPVAHLLRRVGAGELSVAGRPELLDFPPNWMTARDHLLAVLSSKVPTRESSTSR